MKPLRPPKVKGEAARVINARLRAEVLNQRASLLSKFRRLGIHEREDLEPLLDAIATQVRQSSLKQRRWTELEENFSKHELRLKVAEVCPVGDKGGDEWQINKEIRRLKPKEPSGRKPRLARRVLEAVASSGYYGYLLLRKKLGVPLEHPTLRQWYAGFLPWIPSLVNPGGMILLLEGTYSISSSISIDGVSNVCLEGVGFASVIEYPAMSAPAIGVGENAETRGIIIRKLKIVGPGSVDYGSHGIEFYTNCYYTQVNECWVENAGDNGIYGSYASYGLVSRCIVIGAQAVYGGIHPHGDHTWVITNNIVKESADGDAIRHGYIIADNYCLDNFMGIVGGDAGKVITGNYIYNTNREYCIDSWADGQLVVGNVIDSGGNVYVELEGIDVADNNCVVVGNLVKNLSTNANGIRVTGSNNIVSGNSIFNNAYHGIIVNMASHNIIENNFLKDNSQDSNAGYNEIFLMDDGSTFSTHNRVINNVIRCTATNRAAYGIAENAADDDYNVYEGNYIEGAATAPMNILGPHSLVRNNYGHTTTKTVTADYSMTWADEVLLVDASGGAVTVTLPDPAAYPDVWITIKKIDSSSNAVTINPHGSETIDGAASQSLSTENAFLTFVSDGTNWYVVTG